jgi:hypothetical protein
MFSFFSTPTPVEDFARSTDSTKITLTHTLAQMKASLSTYENASKEIKAKQSEVSSLISVLTDLEKKVTQTEKADKDADLLSLVRQFIQKRRDQFIKSKQDYLKIELMQYEVGKLKQGEKDDDVEEFFKRITPDCLTLPDPYSVDNAAEEFKANETHNPIVALRQKFKTKLLEFMQRQKPNEPVEIEKLNKTRTYYLSIIIDCILLHVTENAELQKLQAQFNEICKDKVNIETPLINFIDQLPEHVIQKPLKINLQDLVKRIYDKKHVKINTLLKSIKEFETSLIGSGWATITTALIKQNDSHIINLIPQTHKITKSLQKPTADILFPNLKNNDKKSKKLTQKSVSFERYIQYQENLLQTNSESSANVFKAEIDAQMVVLIERVCANPCDTSEKFDKEVAEFKAIWGISRNAWRIILKVIAIIYSDLATIEFRNANLDSAVVATRLLDVVKCFKAYLTESEPASGSTNSSSFLDKLFLIIPKKTKSLLPIEAKPEIFHSQLIRAEMAEVILALPIPQELERFKSDPQNTALNELQDQKSKIVRLTKKVADVNNKIVTLQQKVESNLDAPLIKLVRIHALHALLQTVDPTKAYAGVRVSGMMHYFHHSKSCWSGKGGLEPVFVFVRKLFDESITDFKQVVELIEPFLRRHATPGSGLHTNSFDTFFLQMLYNTGTPRGLLRLSLNKSEIKAINKLKLITSPIPEDDEELKRFIMRIELPSAKLNGDELRKIRGATTRFPETEKRNFYRTQALEALNNISILLNSVKLGEPVPPPPQAVPVPSRALM